MHSNRGITKIAALLGSAVMIAGMTTVISGAMTIENNANVSTVNTAANSIDSIQALTNAAADGHFLISTKSDITNAANETIKITQQQTKIADKAIEAAKKEAEEKKAEEEAAKKASELYTNAEVNTGWDQGGCLNTFSGVYYGPSGKETYYNLDMSGVISIMRNMGFSEDAYPYWVRDDGCKMLGNYIMVACNLDLRPRGTLVATSLGTGIVCDTSPVFVGDSATQVDVAVTW